MHVLNLRILNRPIRIATDDSVVADMLGCCFSAFTVSDCELAAVSACHETIELSVRKHARDAQWILQHRDVQQLCSNRSDLIYFVEKQVTLWLQYQRPELYFLHAAALASETGCIVVLGESGAGKSTLCWDLCHAGLKYLSDELAPVQLDTMHVEPYPHAICLKQEIRSMPVVPAAAVRTEQTVHIPVEFMPFDVAVEPVPVSAMIFLQRGKTPSDSQVERIGSGEAAARIYSNGLNQLAHAGEGLAAANRLASAVPCFGLFRDDLGAMRRRILGWID